MACWVVPKPQGKATTHQQEAAAGGRIKLLATRLGRKHAGKVSHGPEHPSILHLHPSEVSTPRHSVMVYPGLPVKRTKLARNRGKALSYSPRVAALSGRI